MFELVIKGCEIRFKTDRNVFDDANKEIEQACESAGIEIYGGFDGVLLNQYGEVID